VNNQYTVPLTHVFQQAWPADRILSIYDTTVAYGSIDSAVPVMPVTPARVSRKVFEVPPGSSSAQIQTFIDQAVQAAAAGAVNPIVHLPPGSYQIPATLVIPPQAGIQVVGDALTTALIWTGPPGGTIFELQGPSYATLRNMLMLGLNPSATAISMTHADQPGGRIFIEGSAFGPVTASGLLQTQITAQQQTGVGALTLNNVYNFLDIASSVGPLNATGTVNALVADSWFEGTASALVRVNSGDITYIGAELAPATHTPALQPIVAPILLNDFQGSATFVGVSMALSFVPNGVGIQIGQELASTNALFLGVSALAGPGHYLARTSTGGNVGLVSSNIYTGAEAPVPNQGDVEPRFILNMLNQVRALSWDTSAYQAPAGATDVRFYRLETVDTAGLAISGS
jgi:hypothetical protein